MDESKKYRKQISDLEKEKKELLVVIDTLQASLRRAENSLDGEDVYDYVFTQAAKWSMNFK